MKRKKEKKYYYFFNDKNGIERIRLWTPKYAKEYGKENPDSKPKKIG